MNEKLQGLTCQEKSLLALDRHGLFFAQSFDFSIISVGVELKDFVNVFSLSIHSEAQLEKAQDVFWGEIICSEGF